MSTDPALGAPDSTRVRLIVPDLAVRPIIDAGCCVFPVDELICESLGTPPGLGAVACDSARGEISVELDPRSDRLPLMRTVLDGLGYPVTAVRR